MFGLLINPRPHQDESLLGYLQRLAKANGLPRKELLTAFARADETDVADWLQMMEGPLSWPAVSAEFRDPRPKGVKLWTTHHARYCPICLGEAGYWRESWGLT
ncbi:TniQ family protein, partial [Pseudomonas putida]